MSPVQAIHSRYNPQAEAERYIDALNLRDGIKYFILIEPGLGYLIQALRKRYVQSKIIALHADSRFRAGAADHPDIPAWYPDNAETVQDFLAAEIPDAAAAAMRIIEWRPSLRVYGERCLSLVSESVDFIKRADAGFRTASAFGRKWVGNFFRNTGLIKKALLFQPMRCPLVITGSGPGLENALPRIRELGDRVFLLAASSSFLALRAGGVNPDMLISTDGGSWALSHLYPCFRGPRETAPYLAPAFSAALPSQASAFPFLALNDGSLWQHIILKELDIPSVTVPQRGTVTASALELAMILSSGDIYLAGLDLSVQDIRTHARPYGFDHLFFGAASRLKPVYSQCFARSVDMRQGGSHAVYAGWFKNRLSGRAGRVFSLGNNHEIFEALGKNPPGQTGEREAARAKRFKTVPVRGEEASNRRRGAEALIRFLDDPRYAKTLAAELGPLLFPDRENAAARDLQEAIRAIVTRKEGENHG